MLGAHDRRASSSYISTVGFGAAFLFVAVDWVEPNHRLALVFKTAILAAGGAAIAHQLLPLRSGDGVWLHRNSTKFARHLCAIPGERILARGVGIAGPLEKCSEAEQQQQ